MEQEASNSSKQHPELSDLEHDDSETGVGGPVVDEWLAGWEDEAPGPGNRSLTPQEHPDTETLNPESGELRIKAPIFETDERLGEGDGKGNSYPNPPPTPQLRDDLEIPELEPYSLPPPTPRPPNLEFPELEDTFSEPPSAPRPQHQELPGPGRNPKPPPPPIPPKPRRQLFPKQSHDHDLPSTSELQNPRIELPAPGRIPPPPPVPPRPRRQLFPEQSHDPELPSTSYLQNPRIELPAPDRNPKPPPPPVPPRLRRQLLPKQSHDRELPSTSHLQNTSLELPGLGLRSDEVSGDSHQADQDAEDTNSDPPSDILLDTAKGPRPSEAQTYLELARSKLESYMGRQLTIPRARSNVVIPKIVITPSPAAEMAEAPTVEMGRLPGPGVRAAPTVKIGESFADDLSEALTTEMSEAPRSPPLQQHLADSSPKSSPSTNEPTPRPQKKWRTRKYWFRREDPDIDGHIWEKRQVYNVQQDVQRWLASPISDEWLSFEQIDLMLYWRLHVQIWRPNKSTADRKAKETNVIRIHSRAWEKLDVETQYDLTVDIVELGDDIDDLAKLADDYNSMKWTDEEADEAWDSLTKLKMEALENYLRKLELSLIATAKRMRIPREVIEDYVYQDVDRLDWTWDAVVVADEPTVGLCVEPERHGLWRLPWDELKRKQNLGPAKEMEGEPGEEPGEESEEMWEREPGEEWEGEPDEEPGEEPGKELERANTPYPDSLSDSVLASSFTPTPFD